MHSEEPSKTAISAPKQGFVTCAWFAITILVGIIFYLQTLPVVEEDESGGSEDVAGLVVMELQAKYILGVSKLSGEPMLVSSQAAPLDIGTVEQRQCFMALMIALGDGEAANRSALNLQHDLEAYEKTLNESQGQNQELLEILMQGGELSESQKKTLTSSLGWFGTLLFADEAERQSIEEAEAAKVIVVGLGVLGIFLFGLIGFGFLLFFTTKAMSGKLKSKLNAINSRQGIYAEVFFVWLILFLVLMTTAGIIGLTDSVKQQPLLGISITLCAFFGSLTAVAWALVRGISWAQLKVDIGLHTGTGFIREVLWGILGYGMTLPLMLVGILCTLVLVTIQAMFISMGDGDPFHGTAGGSHPIIVEVSNGGVGMKIGLLMLAAVAAPIVEEIMFRGVLYRQLRMSSARMAHFISVILSIGLTSFVFAAIHPQGWIGIPALMSIAVGMNLLREYRGSLIAPMVIHATSNGIVMTMMIIFMS
ncbi:MAG: type II CAAX endopeptidase family protein [Planctomycetota bacterium]|nr:type II CAAX endopeptidase family protein [Planctomycetota bacterium]